MKFFEFVVYVGIPALFVVTVIGLGGFAWWYFSFFKIEVYSLDRDREKLEVDRIELIKERNELRSSVEAEIREKLKREEQEIENRFSLPIIEGRSWGETLVIVLKLLDMQRRSLPLSVRVCADHEIGRRPYELVRDAFLMAGYWVRNGDETPVWTDLGLKYLDWVYKRYRRNFEQLYSVSEV